MCTGPSEQVSAPRVEREAASEEVQKARGESEKGEKGGKEEREEEEEEEEEEDAAGEEEAARRWRDHGPSNVAFKLNLHTNMFVR